MWKLKGRSIVGHQEYNILPKSQFSDQVEAYKAALEELAIVRTERDYEERAGKVVITGPNGVERFFEAKDVDSLNGIIQGLIRVTALPKKVLQHHPTAA